jgi:hypothetical protein
MIFRFVIHFRSADVLMQDLTLGLLLPVPAILHREPFHEITGLLYILGR